MNVIQAHKFSSNHRSDIHASVLCGCFHCTSVFSPAKIVEWVDQNSTAICPECGIDAVVGSYSGVPITEAFLREMKNHWF